MTRWSGVSLVLLDVEGTTTPIAFVHGVLFPFARARLGEWLSRHAGTDLRRDVVETLRAERAAACARGEAVPEWPRSAGDDNGDEAVVAYATGLMDRDHKSPGLKRWQGLIWEEGYRAGLLHGEVYPDVAPAVRRWREAGRDVAIYSSGSELAQRLLFASTADGDLTPLFSGFFDTAVGAKVEPNSYRTIAAALAHEPAATLFVSDVTRELAAAEAAGCQTLLSIRPGNPAQVDASRYASVTSLTDILL